MNKEILEEILAEICGKKIKNGLCDLPSQDLLSIMIATEGGTLNIEGVNKVELKDHYFLAHAERNEIYFIVFSRVVAVKLQRAKKEGAGFLT